jgi:hypothetical protein
MTRYRCGQVDLCVLILGLLAAVSWQPATAFTGGTMVRGLRTRAAPSQRPYGPLFMDPSHAHAADDDNNDDTNSSLPRLQYAKLWQSLQSTLDTARTALHEAQSLSRWLESLEAIDPDLSAPIHAESLSRVQQDNDEEIDIDLATETLRSSPQRQQQQFGSTITSTNTMRRRRSHHHISDPLLQAVEHAVACSDRLGRFSPAAAQAWNRVDMVLQQGQQLLRKRLSSNIDPHNLALLSHPSYRYSYATNVVLRSRREHGDDAPRLVQSSIRNSSVKHLQQGLDETVSTLSLLQDVISSERRRLQEADFERALRLRTWNHLWYRDQ